MRTITIWLVGGVLAATEIYGLRFFCGKSNRFERAAPVRAVTKGLRVAASTGTPEVSLALGDFDPERCFCGINWFFTHLPLLSTMYAL